jgi:hypothetical protein
MTEQKNPQTIKAEPNELEDSQLEQSSGGFEPVNELKKPQPRRAEPIND